jgi:hypothetical protein
MVDLTKWNIEDNTFWENFGKRHSITFNSYTLAPEKTVSP